MIIGKDQNGKVRYLGSKKDDMDIDLQMRIKNIEAGMLLFTFQESTTIAASRDRMVIDGDLPAALAAVRILDMVEVFLLPKFLAKLAVKKYPQWSPTRKYIGRALIYLRAVAGF
jgi:hypothetical protein